MISGCGGNLGEKQMDKMVEIKWHDKNAQKMTVHNKNGVVYLTYPALDSQGKSFMDSVPDWEG